MMPFASIFMVRLKRDMQYRAAMLFGMFTQIGFGLIICMVREAFYRVSDGGDVMTLAQVVTYSWIGQATLRTQPWGGDPEIMALVRSGDVAYELLRPVRLYAYWYARALALRAAPMALIFAPQIIIAAYLMPEGLRLALPPAAGWLAFAASMAGALLLSASITNIYSISLLFTVSGEVIVRLLPGIGLICTGMVVPLRFFPEWLSRIFYSLPFAGLFDLPAQLFAGSLPASALPGVLANQLIWTCALVAAGLLLQSAGLRRMHIQGG